MSISIPPGHEGKAPAAGPPQESQRGPGTPRHSWTRRRRILAAGLTAASAAGMAISLTLPTIWYQTLGSPEEVYSILGGIRALWEDGTPLLCIIVFGFSIALPLFKLGVASAIVLRGGATRRTAAVLRGLHAAGRWSTLDFWVVGLFVSAVQLGVTRSETRPGIQLFMLAMVTATLATRVIRDALGHPPSSLGAPRLRTGASRAAALGRVTHLLGTLSLLAAPFTVMLGVRKGILKEHAFSLGSAIRERAADGELWLAGGLAAFMVLIPLARAFVSGVAHWSGGGPNPRLVALERELGRWCMLDVLALALMIVVAKLDDLATISVGPGAALVFAAAALKAGDSALLRLRAKASIPPQNVPR